MNKSMKRALPRSFRRHAAGMTLLDILLAIVIFVVGMVALAQLQGNLARSAGDANARTVASNIAEEVIESLRTYDRLEVDAGDACPTALADMQTKKVFECIADPAATLTLTRGGINYDVDIVVTDWYFKNDREELTSDKSDSDLQGRDLSIPDFKEVQVAVDWAAAEFRIDDENADTFGSGSFAANTTIPSVPVLGGAKIAADDDGLPGTPPVEYTPGQLPDVIPINLEGNKFKESQTPMPDVIRADNIVETWFDVVTYNLGNNGSTYLRREEFAVLACECILRNSAGGDGDGFLPTTWNGLDYTEGAWVAKQWGESANNQQSQYCDTCCRDHHDAPGNTNPDTLYRPFTSATHSHWAQDKKGNWVEATKDGDEYLETCRMVRKDGFLRVAQDFDLRGIIATRQAFFTSTDNVSAYSTHVTDETAKYFSQAGNGDFSGGMSFPGDAENNAVPLPRAEDGADFDQQVSRSLYTDYVNSELAEALTCVKNGEACAPPNVTEEIEILPFYEIQTTWLSFWKDNVDGDPVFVSNETIKSDNAHSRGDAERTGTSAETVAAETYIHNGNNGLTSTDPIDPDYDTNLFFRDHFIVANGGGGGGPGGNPHGVSGTMSGSGGIKASDATFLPDSGVYCTYDANTFECVYDYNEAPLPEGSGFTITDYRKNKDAWVCITDGDPNGLVIITNNSALGIATVDLSGVEANMITGIHLSFQPDPCL